jgi:hypothetical protein
MPKPRVGAGSVLIYLDGQAVILKPTIGAIRKLLLIAGDGGLPSLRQKCAVLDPDSIVAVIAAGTSRGERGLIRPVFEAGYSYLAPKCDQYLINLLCFGMPPSDDEPAKPDTGKLVTLEDLCAQAEKRAMGWLGWTEAQTINTDINAITVALEGRTEMLTAIFGGKSKEPTVSDQPMNTSLFDRLFGGKSKRKK